MPGPRVEALESHTNSSQSFQLQNKLIQKQYKKAVWKVLSHGVTSDKATFPPEQKPEPTYIDFRGAIVTQEFTGSKDEIDVLQLFFGHFRTFPHWLNYCWAKRNLFSSSGEAHDFPLEM